MAAIALCGLAALLVSVGVVSALQGLEIVVPTLVGFILYGLRRQRRWWESFEIAVTEDTIVQRAVHGREIAVRRDEVTEVLRGPGGWLIVKAGDQEDAPKIVIPSQLEGFAELEAVLEVWSRRP